MPAQTSSTTSAVVSFVSNVVMFVFMIFLMGVLIANIVYFRRFSGEATQTHISHGAAVSMVGISIFLLILTIMGLIFTGFMTIWKFFMVFNTMDMNTAATNKKATKPPSSAHAYDVPPAVPAPVPAPAACKLPPSQTNSTWAS